MQSKKRKILAIDDDVAVTAYLQAKLGAEYDVVVTNQRAEKIALFRGRSYRIRGEVIQEA